MTHDMQGVQPGDSIDICQSEVTAGFVRVSSDVAARWLAHNTHNRPLSEMAVLRYQADMEAGRFGLTGEPIQFSRSGVLLNGQNRLTALANCVPPVSLTMLVVRGLEDTVQKYMDQGVKRTPGQQLALLGVKNSAQVASSVRLLMSWRNGLLFSESARTRNALSAAAVESWVAENEKLIGLFNKHLAHVVRSVGGTPSVAGALGMHGLEVDPQATISFLHLLAGRSNLPFGSPLLALDSRLRNLKANRTRVNQRDELGYFIQTWNAWMRGDSMAKLQAGRGGWSSENFPRMEGVRGSRFSVEQFARGLALAGYEL